MAITGKLVYKVNIGTYTGLTSDTAETVINPETREIEVNVLKVPNGLIITKNGESFVFDGSTAASVVIPTYALADLGSSENVLKSFSLTLDNETQDTINIASPIQDVIDHTQLNPDDYVQLLVRDSTGIYFTVYNSQTQAHEFVELVAQSEVDDILLRLSAVESSLADEIRDRGNADTTLQTNIDASGHKIQLEINSSTFVLVAKLYDANNNLISTSSQIDLPLESVVVNGSYDSQSKSIILTLQNGNTITIPVGDLVSGLETTIDGAASTIAHTDLTTNRALVSDANGKVAVSSVTNTELGYVSGVTSAIQTQLNAKQDTLSSQTAYTSKGTSTKVPQITTNALGQVTNITEVDIDIPHVDYPVTDVEVNGTSVVTNTVASINLKTINGNDVVGSGNIVIETYQPFNASWPTSNSYTTAQFCAAVNAESSAVVGMAYLGGASWSDLPFVGNGDVVVEVMQGPNNTKAIHLILTSSNVAPYHWEYTYWNNGSTSGWRGFQPQLSAGSNITISNNVISATDTTYSSLNPAEGGLDESLVTTGEKYVWNAKQDALVNQSNIKSVNNNSLLGSGNLSIVEGALSRTGAELEDGNYVVGQLYYCTANSDSFTAGSTYVATGVNSIVKLTSTNVNTSPAITAFTISPTSTEFGDAKTVTYSYTLKKYSQITDLALDGTIIAAQPASASGTGTASSAYYNHTFTLSGTGVTSKTATISPIYRHFIGVMSSDVVSTILSSLKNVTTDTATLKTYLQNNVPSLFEADVGSTATYIYFVIKGTINTIKSGGFDVPFELVQSATFTNSYDAQYSVNVYRTSNKVFGVLSFNIN